LLAVVALGINGIIGQGIFFTPGLAAQKFGPASILAIVCGGVICFLIAICFAEVGSQFRSTGGAYLYAREAFGEFVGFEVGWLTCCVAVISWAALATGFTNALAQFVPSMELADPPQPALVADADQPSATALAAELEGASLQQVLDANLEGGRQAQAAAMSAHDYLHQVTKQGKAVTVEIQLTDPSRAKAQAAGVDPEALRHALAVRHQAELLAHNRRAWWPRALVMLALLVGLTLVNLRGAKQGARVSTFFSIAKLVPLALFVIVGLFHLQGDLFTPFVPVSAPGQPPLDFGATLAETTLVLLYAYVGFETLVVPAGEMQNPQRSVPLAMFVVMAVVSAVYILVLTVAVGTFPDLAGHRNPIAAASEQMMGPIGGTIIAAGILISVFGTNAGAALVSPRRFYALAERGDLPPFLATLHPKTGVPYWAMFATAGLALPLALSGSFKALAALAVLARFLQYIPTCLAVLILRERENAEDDPQRFTLPFGPVIPLLSIGLCAWLMWNTDPAAMRKGVLAVILGLPLYWWSVHKGAEKRRLAAAAAATSA